MSASVERIYDPGIPTLQAVLTPEALAEHLRELLPVSTKELHRLQVRVLRYHRGKRCVVEVTLPTTEGSLSLIGKVYSEDRSDVYRRMQELVGAGFGPDDEFSVPRPTAYLPTLQLLLQERVEGRPATGTFLSEHEAERAAVAERCARWLTRFHATAPPVGRSVRRSDQQLSIERWFRRLSSLGEALAGKAGELFKRLEAAASDLHPVAERSIHGDYTHHQVLLAEGRTVTVDWDKHSVADPSRDVASFMVGLQRLGLQCRGSLRALDDAVGVFLKTYWSTCEPETMANLPFYRAAVCLRFAKKEAKHRAARWHEMTEATLDEGLRVLENPLVHGGATCSRQALPNPA